MIATLKGFLYSGKATMDPLSALVLRKTSFPLQTDGNQYNIFTFDVTLGETTYQGEGGGPYTASQFKGSKSRYQKHCFSAIYHRYDSMPCQRMAVDAATSRGALRYGMPWSLAHWDLYCISRLAEPFSFYDTNLLLQDKYRLRPWVV